METNNTASVTERIDRYMHWNLIEDENRVNAYSAAIAWIGRNLSTVAEACHCSRADVLAWYNAAL